MRLPLVPLLVVIFHAIPVFSDVAPRIRKVATGMGAFLHQWQAHTIAHICVQLPHNVFATGDSAVPLDYGRLPITRPVYY